MAEPGRREREADEAAGLRVELREVHQLVLFGALARGTTRYRVPADSEHLRTNLWLAERFGARARRDGPWVEIDGLGLRR